jgi:hypothetical protein
MFPGRLGGAATFRKYQQGGPAAISPHIIPQNSLHSVSSAISISLAMRGPNFGIGGGPEALAEGLTVAMTLLDTSDLPGLWLVLTQWAPEPVPDGQGSTQTETICLAVALGLVPGAEHDARGMTLRLTATARPEAIGRQIRVVSEAGDSSAETDSGPGGLRRPARLQGDPAGEADNEGGLGGRSNLPRLLDLARWLAGGAGGRAAPWSYCLPWGGRIELAESNYLQQTKAA